MNTRELELVAGILTTAIERTADAIGRAVQTALAPPPIPGELPGSLPSAPVLSVEQQRLVDEFLADPTDSEPWLQSERPVASMGPSARNPLRGG